jgi:ligand-binding SRPBCC domain-containing protein
VRQKKREKNIPGLISRAPTSKLAGPTAQRCRSSSRLDPDDLRADFRMECQNQKLKSAFLCSFCMLKPLKIELRTEVNGHYRSVMKRFDRNLFEALSPPVGKIEVVKFTGSKTGDQVHLQFVRPLKAEWISRITDHGERKNELYFVDEGKKLPPGLAFWKHEHIVRKKSESRSIIIDRIHFKSYFYLLSLLFYPILFLTFYPRKKQYKSYFEHKNNT